MLNQKTRILFDLLAEKVFTEDQRSVKFNQIKELGIEKSDVLKKNKHGDLPLHIACNNGYCAKTIELLLDLNSNINDINNYERSALWCAASAGDSGNSLATLISRNADVTMQNRFGNNILHVVAANRYPPTRVKDHIALNLLGQKVRETLGWRYAGYINCKNSQGKTPLHIAAEFDNIEFFQFLIDREADKDEKDNAGKTAFEIRGVLISKYLEEKKELWSYDYLTVERSDDNFNECSSSSSASASVLREENNAIDR